MNEAPLGPKHTFSIPVHSIRLLVLLLELGKSLCQARRGSAEVESGPLCLANSQIDRQYHLYGDSLFFTFAVFTNRLFGPLPKTPTLVTRHFQSGCMR